MKAILKGVLLLGILGLSGSAHAEYRTYTDYYGNPISASEYNRQLSDFQEKASRPGSYIDSRGWVVYWPNQSSNTASYYTKNNYGTSYGTTNNYGTSYNTINNYGNSHTTINNYGTGRTTVNDYGGSRTTVNRRGR